MSKLDAEHEDFQRYKLDWDFLADAIAGERSIKERAEQYLPMTPGMVMSKHVTHTDDAGPYRIDYRKRAEDRYFNYKLRAEFPEKVGPACDVAVGLMTDRPATFEAPTQMLGVQEVASSEGDTLAGMHQQIANMVCGYGRCGLWVDVWPSGQAPYLVIYDPRTIINWHETTIDGERTLDRLVVRQDGEDDDGKPQDELLIYTLRLEGVVLEKFVKKKEASADQYMLIDTPQPRTRSQAGEALADDAGGVAGFRLRRIPFQFVNATSTKPAVSRAPFLALATQCLKAYRMDANYQEALSFYEPTPVITGMSEEWIQAGLAPTSFGAGALWMLPEGADAKMLEYSGPSIENLRQGIVDAIGRADEYAKAPFERNITQVESGEAKKQRARTQTSAMKVAAQNIGTGIEKALRIGAEWIGLNPLDVNFTPNLEFVEMAMDAQEILAISAIEDAGKISARTRHERYRSGGLTDRTFEEEQAEIEAGGAPGITEDV